MLAQTIRRGIVVPLATAFVVLLAGAASACVSRYHDGSDEQTMDFDYFDDVAQKVLDGPLVANPVPGEATLTIEGTAYGCTNNSAVFALSLNGTPIAAFNCSAFSWWGGAEFKFPSSLVQTGPASNRFSLANLDNTWDTGIYLEVDQNSFYTRSTMVANGQVVTGELLWSLNVPGLVCYPQP